MSRPPPSGGATSQYVGKNAALHQEGDFERGFDRSRHHKVDARRLSITGAVDTNPHTRPWRQDGRIGFYLKGISSGERQLRGRELRGQLQWNDAHADQVRAVDSLEAQCEHRTYTEQPQALG